MIRVKIIGTVYLMGTPRLLENIRLESNFSFHVILK